MFKVKSNYKNGYRDQTCRACKTMPKTHNYIVVECESLHQANTKKREGGSFFKTEKMTLDHAYNEQTETV